MKWSVTHGESGTKLYDVWVSMVQRCHNPNQADYGNYGGRGIRVCRGWRKFENFLQWSLDNGYKTGLSIDRINNGKGYSPENCRWATSSQQNRNQRKRLDNKSGYIGVHKVNGKWRSQARIEGGRVHLGYFDDPFSAAWVRDEYVKQFDPHATTNNLTDRRKRSIPIEAERRKQCSHS